MGGLCSCLSGSEPPRQHDIYVASSPPSLVHPSLFELPCNEIQRPHVPPRSQPHCSASYRRGGDSQSNCSIPSYGRRPKQANEHSASTSSQNRKIRGLLDFAPTKRISDVALVKHCKHGELLRKLEGNRALLTAVGSEARDIIVRVQRGTRNDLKVISVRENLNLYMKLTFQLKKAEMFTLHGGKSNVSLLFHGTPTKNIDNICERNFDWRLHGTNKGHIFGRGVCFSPLPSYASHYSDESSQHENIMFLAEVLLAHVAVGANHMKIPPKGFDTTAKPDNKVIVKYDDHTYYPKYVITYYGVVPDIKDIYKKKKGARKVAKNMLSEKELTRFNCCVDDLFDSICECLEQTEEYNSEGLFTKRQVASILPGMRDLLSKVESLEESHQDLVHRKTLLSKYEAEWHVYQSRFHNYCSQH